jgi:hypothetical protein
MKIDLQSYKQEKKSVTEYEVGFNKMVRFVPHVAYNEIEKASQFRQGLKPSIRHALGAFPLVDFHTTVEQALGLEMQHQYTMESQKFSGVDQPRGQDARRGNTGGPAHKRGKFQHQCHHPYHGKSSESGTSGGSTQRYWAVPKPRLGLVCFRCGDAHRHAECQWSGRCYICSQNHKDVVYRRNANGKLKWEPVTSSSSQGTVNMMSSAEQQFSVPLPPQQFYVPGLLSSCRCRVFLSIWLRLLLHQLLPCRLSLELHVCLTRRLSGVLLLTSLWEFPLLRVFPELMCYPLRMAESKETW